MSLTVPTSVRETLSDFEFSVAQKFNVEFIFGNSMLLNDYGPQDNVIKLIRKDYLELKRKGINVGDDWVEFITTKLVTRDELLFLVSDKSPLCANFHDGRGALAWRYRLLMEGFSRGDFAPLAMRKIWQSQLEISRGDALEAEINLEFSLPQLIAAKDAGSVSALRLWKAVKRFEPSIKLAERRSWRRWRGSEAA